MNKILWSSVLALTATAFFSACGDETTNITETTGLTSVDKFKNLAECTAENEGELVYVKDSAKAYLCGASEWTSLSADNSDGKNGLDGKDGKNGTDGKNGKDGASCTVKPIENGYKVLCGGDSVGVLLNGAKGDSGAQGVQGKSGENCTGKTLENGDIQISCGKDFTGVLHNGTDGKEGKSAYEIAKEEDPTITDVASWLESLKGNPGTSCTATALSDSSGFELTCGGNVVGTISNGKDGADGKGFMDDWMVDPRDKQLYRVVTIGSQTWMAENLNYKVENSWCGGGSGGTEGDCAMYGRLYTWAAAVDKSEDECGYGHECHLDTGRVQGICPDGWHVPSYSEWDILYTELGGISTCGRVLRSKTGWEYVEAGTDSVGFSVLPAGIRAPNGYFDDKGEHAYMWSASEYDDIQANLVRPGSGGGGYSNKNNALSVRCLKD
jgi:uncharacterized protein (TIGR02145 family)